MGCWGTGPFDSDHAADFAGAVEHCTDTQARTDLLTATLGAYLELKFTATDFDARYEFPGEIEEAVASAAYVADRKTGKGQFTNNPYAQGHDEATDTWYTIELDEPTPKLVALAKRAMERLLRQMRSALVDPEWRNPIVDILEALT
jgi:hypothetical protein